MNRFKKINFAILKPYFINHGEKIALGSCVFIALLLGLLGLLRAMSAGRDTTGRIWADELNNIHNRITGDIQKAQPAPLNQMQLATLDKNRYDWPAILLAHAPSLYLHATEKGGQDKRMNPTLLAVMENKKQEKKYFQLDYIQACMLLYQNDQESRHELIFDGAAPAIRPQPGTLGSLPSLAKRAEPSRMVVGYALFPMQEQVELFRKALRMASQKELFSGNQFEDLPRVIGFTLKRYEIGADGKPVNPAGEILIGFDKAGNQKIAPSLRRMLREAVYDVKMAEYLEPYLHAGLTMPLPKLGNAHYPQPDLEDVKIDKWYQDDDKRGAVAVAPIVQPNKAGGVKLPGGKLPGIKDRPMPPPGGEPVMAGLDGKKREISYKDLKAMHPPLAERLFCKEKDIDKYVNVYHPLGVSAKDERKTDARFFHPWKFRQVAAFKPEDPVSQPEGKLDPQVKPQGKPPEEAAEQFPPWDKDAIVRFIDPEVEPGSIYEYGIQIRMASPNFGKKHLVAFDKIANDRELEPSIEVRSPRIVIPHEFHLYAVDQQLLDKWADNEEDKKAVPAKDRDMTMFQIHQWVKKKEDLINTRTHLIGDWAVAERIAVRRGDPIGIKAAVVVPVWNELRDTFEVPRLVDDPAPKDKKNVARLPGININLTDTIIKDGAEVHLLPPVLVDFHGGRRYKPNGVFDEETAVDALIMMPDGTLKVMNSRLDSDPISADARERHERVMVSRRRANAFMGRGADPLRKLPGEK